MRKANCLVAAVLIGIFSLSFHPPIARADEIIPGLASVPANLPNQQRTQLNRRKQALQSQLASFQSAANTFNAEKAESQTDAEYNALQAQRSAYIDAANAFNRDVAAEVASNAQMPPAPLPVTQAKNPKCVRGAGVQSKAGELGTVSPAMFVTHAQCESASNELARLQKQRDNLTAKIAEVQGWSAGLSKDETEFENMRVEAHQDLAWEFIDHVPVADGLDALKENPALSRMKIDKIKAAYQAAKGLLETGRGISAKDDHEKAEKILDGNRALRDAMMSAAGMDERSKALLDATSKFIDYGAKAAIAAGTNNMSDRDRLKTVMTLVEALQPWWGVGVMGENLAERGVQYRAAGVALDSLHQAQSSNWNAQRFLTDKLNKVDEEAKEELFIVQKYQMTSTQSHQ